jgi:hypothetical protein
MHSTRTGKYSDHQRGEIEQKIYHYTQ